MTDSSAAREAAPISQLSAPELKTMIDNGMPFELIDVRTDGERAIASIEGSRLLDKQYYEELLLLTRETPLVFVCHHGIRSQGAAEHFQGEGFRRLYNLRGGIDAWSVLVDTSIARY
jgi:monothiol glutaredoxin